MNRIVPESKLAQSLTIAPLAGRKVCIVTGELEGPFYNGGVGTTNRALALVLRAMGCEVDILYTHVDEGKALCLRGSFPEHVETYNKLGVRLKCIDHRGKWYDWKARSYLSLQYLLHHRYDVVFFDDMCGAAYYPLLARRTGNRELRSTKMCVTTHSSTQWTMDLNEQPVATVEQLSLMEMERRGVELADAIKAPSAYILQKYRSYGWTIPDNFIVLPNFVSAEQALVQPPKRMAVKEIVFFGRLETRKGLWMFCKALDRLKFRLKDYRVTFLGKAIVENNCLTAETILRCSASWPFAIRLLTTFDRNQALAYLKRDGLLAVLPSPEDNSPSVILECLEAGVPFLACSGSGGEELIDEKGREANLFDRENGE